MTSSSLRQRQIDSLKTMLNLNTSGGREGEPTWKVLVYDKVGQDILGPVLSVKELRELGVTLHLRLLSSRDPIPDAPAVYFCLPSDDNIRQIGQDMENGLYGGYHFNFISPVSRAKLEDLATSALQSNSVQLVQKIFDQYINFICLEDEMFCLKQSLDNDISYYSLNRGDVTDTEMDNILNNITDSLFSLCVTLGTVPIIRCPKGNAAEAVAEKLDKKLGENLRDSRNSLFTGDGAASGRYSFHRPVFVLLDRGVDMATPLHHTWTYQALAHDVLPYHQNRVTISSSTADSLGGARSKDKVFELDPGDQFWSEHKGTPFPQVAEAIQEKLEEIKGREEDIKKMKEDMGLAGEDVAAGLASLDIGDNTARLTSAVSSLPQLLEKKRLIDQHTNIATAVLDKIKVRRLDVFFELEEKIMSGTTLDKSIMEVLNDPESGSPDDKMRLFLIFFLCSPTMTDAELDQYSGALQSAGCDLAPLTYMKRWKTYSKLQTGMGEYNQGQGQGTIKAVNMFGKLIGGTSSFVMEGVKNFMVKKHNLPLTKIVDEMMEQKAGKYNDEYRYMDPKSLRGGSEVPRSKTAFSDAVVFVVGGGNYIEYQNLQDYVKNKNGGYSSGPGMAPTGGRRVVYGCTQLSNADHMLKQLQQLGTEV